MAVEYDEGVIIGADSRTTTGYVSYFKNSSLQLNSLPISYCISSWWEFWKLLPGKFWQFAGILAVAMWDADLCIFMNFDVHSRHRGTISIKYHLNDESYIPDVTDIYCGCRDLISMHSLMQHLMYTSYHPSCRCTAHTTHITPSSASFILCAIPRGQNSI